MGLEEDVTTGRVHNATAPQPHSGSAGSAEGPVSRRLLWHVTVWVAAAVIAVALLFVTFGRIAGGSWWPWDGKQPPELFPIIRSTVTVVALLGGTVAAAIAIRRQRSTEQTVVITARAQETAAAAAQTAARAAEIAAEAAAVQANAYELDRERHTGEQIRDLRQRFITAGQQIGNAGSAAVRIAGLYAMTALADDWLNVDLPREAQTCIDVLCAYLRMPPDPDLDEHMRLRFLSSDVSREVASELEVRHTAQRLIVDYVGRHPHRHEAPSIDLTGAHLHDFSAMSTTFGGKKITFGGATFSGETTLFATATFSGERTSFGGTAFNSPTTSFGEARFTGGETWFDGASFNGERTWFTETIFGGSSISFAGVTFGAEDTWFNEAQFTSARTYFTRATFSGKRAWFDRAMFNGMRTRFENATFQNEHTSFSRAKFNGEDTWFSRVTFGGTITFDGASFDGGHASFAGATFDGEHVSFAEATFGPSVRVLWSDVAAYEAVNVDLPEQLMRWGALRESGIDTA